MTATSDKRAFLERSLADLDDELAAGDLAEADHARLRADYERRLAALDAPRAERAPPSRRRGPSRTATTVGVIVLVALLSGVLLAQAVGRRGAGDSVTGIDLTPEEAAEPPVATATTLSTALQGCLEASGSAAVSCFIEYTRANPEDARGFMHFGLFSIRQGLELDN